VNGPTVHVAVTARLGEEPVSLGNFALGGVPAPEELIAINEVVYRVTERYWRANKAPIVYVVPTEEGP
jgi:hypothetical protein